MLSCMKPHSFWFLHVQEEHSAVMLALHLQEGGHIFLLHQLSEEVAHTLQGHIVVS